MEVSPDLGVPFPAASDSSAKILACAKAFFESGSATSASTTAQPPRVFIGYQEPNTAPIQRAPKTTIDCVSVKALLEQVPYSEFKDSGELHKYVMSRWVDMSAPGAEYPHNVQLKALENLAKAGGMMVERSEVTIKDKPTGELEERLRAKLARFMGSVDITDIQAQFRELMPAPASTPPPKPFASLIDEARDD